MSAESLEFSFSHTHRFTEEQYVELKGLLAHKKRWTRWALTVFAAFACLFSTYTILLGVGLIVFLALSLWMPRMIPGTVAKVFHASPLLQSDIRYGVDNEGLSVECATLTARVPWRGSRYGRRNSIGSGLRQMGCPNVGSKSGSLERQVSTTTCWRSVEPMASSSSSWFPKNWQLNPLYNYLFT